MTTQPHTPAFRMTALRLLLASAVSLVAVAAPASALLGLPVALPGTGQHIDTPVGSIDADAGAQGASACIDAATPALPVPALPSLPALPLPVPVPVPAVPALPTPSAGAKVCANASDQGASASVDANAPGASIGTGLDAQSPVPLDQVGSTAGQGASEAKGFFDTIVETLFGWL